MYEMVCDRGIALPQKTVRREGIECKKCKIIKNLKKNCHPALRRGIS